MNLCPNGPTGPVISVGGGTGYVAGGISIGF
jgi:hypothetical protein